MYDESTPSLRYYCPEWFITVTERKLEHKETSVFLGSTLGQCSGLNKNGPQRLMYLNTWSPVSGSVWEGLGGGSLLEEVCH